MANGDDELDQQHGQGAGELDGPEVGEQDAQGDDLRGYDQHLGQLVKQGEQAGYGAQTATLKRIRKALRNTNRLVSEAEERGRQRALQEFSSGDGGQAVQAIRAQVQAELAEQNGRERSLARLGLPGDSPLRALFSDVTGDFAEYQRRADALRSQGISWGTDPLVQQLSAARLQATTQAATHAQENGGPVNVAPAAGVPPEVQEQLLRGATEAMQAGQAGGQPPHAPDLESDIRKAAQNPGAYSPEELEGLANRFNRELDGLAHYMGGGGPL